jgi:DNA mismatch repair protein MutL
MSKIITLDESTINKIAAGEVVERPAAVVKELVENSIDAGATRINIEIKKGGISFIKVSDNGSGIEEDDVVIAFDRHSTSKIKHSTELSSIMSLGFRGEALASIAAVSKVEMVTRTKSKPYGIQINLTGGNIENISQTGAPIGTLIAVRDIFYNTPARFKFLKRDATEAGYVSDIVNRIALSNPSISIKLESNGSTIINTPGNNDLLSTIVSIYGTDVGKSVLEINYNDDLVSITGYAGEPKISRSNRNYQSIFVNGRYVKSKLITSAIDEAYRTYLMKNRFAFVVLKIEINPVAIDINVHPAKMEVRFSDESRIYRAVYHAIRNTLLSGSKIKEIKVDDNSKLTNSSIKSEDIEAVNYRQTSILDESNQRGIFQNSALPVEKMQNSPTIDSNKLVLKENGKHYDSLNAQQDIQNIETETNISRDIKDARLIGQLFSTYIILQKDDYIFIVDQHAAHERIIFEEIKRRFSNNEPMSQTLIVPTVIDLTYQEIKTLDEHRDFFNKLGFIYEEFGNNSIIVRAVPYGEVSEDEREIFLQLLDIATTYVKEDYNVITDRALYKIACKAAVKANMSLENEETMEMLKKLSMLENPYTCPHGRPTIIRISKAELEKIFKRRL